MKRILTCATLCVAMLASCNKDANEGNQTNDEGTLTSITLKTGSYTKSFDPKTETGQNALFNDANQVTVNALDDRGAVLVSVQTLLDRVSPDGSTFVEYTANLPLPSTTAKVDVVLNADGTEAGSRTLTAASNSRQGGTDMIAVLINRENDTTGVVEKDDDDPSQAKATLVLGPEMARLEMVNNLNTAALVEAFLNKPTTVNVENTLARAVSPFDATYRSILSFYGDLRISSYYIDNLKLNRGDANITDYNKDYVDPTTWIAKYSATPNHMNAVSGGIITNASGVVPGSATDYDFLPLTGNETSVGYNLFEQDGQNAPASLDAAKVAHPHFIIEIKYYPATEYTFDGTNLVATAWSTTELTRYINLAAFDEGSGVYAKFERGHVYQFTLEDVLDLLLENIDKDITPEDPDPDPVVPPTPDPDQKFNVAMQVQVLDWQVVPVTPLPL